MNDGLQVSNKKINKDIKTLINVLKLTGPQKIILFGSAAKDKMHPESDVDVCVIKEIKGSTMEEKRKILGLLWQKGFNYTFDPDIKIYSPSMFERELQKGHPFLQEINKGQVVYEK